MFNSSAQINMAEKVQAHRRIFILLCNNNKQYLHKCKYYTCSCKTSEFEDPKLYAYLVEMSIFL